MTEVARAAGVSVSTVSHVVNGTRVVAAPTRQRVVAALRELGYQHSSPVAALHAGRRPTIGLAVTANSNPYWGMLASAVDEAAYTAGMNVLVADTWDDPQREELAVANLLAHHVDALVLAPSRRWTARVLPMLRQHPKPVVLIDRLLSPKFDQVGIDNVQPVETLVGHLLDLGHQRVGIITGDPLAATSGERLRGYVNAHVAHDHDVDPTLIVGGLSTQQGGYDAMQRLLEASERATAVVVSNNSMTVGALGALRDHGLHVPADMALVAFDDHPWADVVEPRLTTVEQPLAEIGVAAVSLIRRRMADPGAAPRTIRLAATISHRDSCGCSGGPLK